MKKSTAFFIAFLGMLIVSGVIVIPVLYSTGLLIDVSGNFIVKNFLRWEIFVFVTVFLLALIVGSHKFFSGRFGEVAFVASSLLLFSEIVAYLLFTLLECRFDFRVIDWFGSLDSLITSWIFYMILGVVFAVLFLGYCLVINRNFIKVFSNSGINGNGKLKQVNETNLENSRWMNEKERKENFKTYKYTKLGEVTKDGIPVIAELDYNKKDMKVAFNSPCHAIVIGSTGSGKTTTFVSPMIQILAATKAGSSMVITDPKGELFGLHSKFLKDRGYDVKVVDLRDTYSSYRWNPLDSIWDAYEDYRNAHLKAYKRTDDALASGLELTASDETFKNAQEWYEFCGKAYADYDMLITAVKTYRKKIYDDVYEDLNDLVSVLIPIMELELTYSSLLVLANL